MSRYAYVLYPARQPIAGVIAITWVACGFGSAALGNSPASILPVLLAIGATIAIVVGRRVGERHEAEDEWQYQQDLARYQAEVTAWAIARNQQGYDDEREWDGRRW